MGNPLSTLLLFILMVTVIVAVDVLFFASRTYTWDRLIVNVGIVLIFIAIYLRFLK